EVEAGRDPVLAGLLEGGHLWSSKGATLSQSIQPEGSAQTHAYPPAIVQGGCEKGLRFTLTLCPPCDFCSALKPAHRQTNGQTPCGSVCRPDFRHLCCY